MIPKHSIDIFIIHFHRLIYTTILNNASLLYYILTMFYTKNCFYTLLTILSKYFDYS